MTIIDEIYSINITFVSKISEKKSFQHRTGIRVIGVIATFSDRNINYVNQKFMHYI